MENHMRASPQWDRSSKKIIILPKQFYQLMIKHSVSEAIETVLVEIIAVCEAVCMPGLERECQIPCGRYSSSHHASLRDWSQAWGQTPLPVEPSWYPGDILDCKFPSSISKVSRARIPEYIWKREAFSIYCGHFSKQVQKKCFRIEPNIWITKREAFMLLTRLVGKATNVEADLGFGLYLIKSKFFLIAMFFVLK